jgi:hypothetical protein
MGRSGRRALHHGEMTLRAADLRFALPHHVDTAQVLRGSGSREVALSGTATGLAAAGVTVSGTPGTVDLVVADAADLGRALAVPARSYLLLGRPDTQAVRRSGRRATSLLVQGETSRPVALVPMRTRQALGHYLSSMTASPSTIRRVRTSTVASLVRTGLPAGRLIPAGRLVTVLPAVADHDLLPEIVAAARDCGLPASVQWLLALGRGDDLQRAVFHLLDGDEVRWVLKFSRVVGADASFSRDEAGLRLASKAGGVVAAHAPSHLGRFAVSGLPASLETAAPGRPLLGLLNRRPVDLVDSIAAWVVRVGVDTATPPTALRGERDRLSADVLPRWTRAGAPGDLVAGLPEVPGVLQHNDLGSWNIVTDGRSFAAVDWESARPVGMPLWDLVYLLADALVRMDGPAAPGVQLQRCLDLFRGRSALSATLFHWVRTAVERLRLPHESVGPLTTLCWLHHGLSADSRAAALGGGTAAPLGHLALIAEPWLADPALGPTWSAWSR